MIISAVLALGFSGALLAAPHAVARLFGLELDGAARLAARSWGVELLGVGLLCWFLRRLAPGRPRRGLLLAFVLADLAGVVVLLQAQLSGLLSPLGWAGLAFYAGLIALYLRVWRRE